jgi:hypothetical protein
MKNLKLIFLTMLFLGHFLNLKAQNNNLTKTFDIKDFDKLEIANLNGEVNIELGKTFSITIAMDSQQFESLQVEKNAENKLKIGIIKQKKENWYAKNEAKITITMPEISKLYNNSNADISIQNFIGRYLGIENGGNGDISLNGQVVDLLDIENVGNGDVKAKNIETKSANVSKYGNGNIEIKANQTFKAKLAGNGDIINFGKGEAQIIKRNGNGQVIRR